MKENLRNVYQNARRTAGLTQERWAEVLGITPEAVRQYERGVITPQDDIVLRMAEVAGQHIICYWHLLNKSRVAAQLLPELQEKELPEAVLTLLVQIEALQDTGLRELIRIAADGKVDPSERPAFDQAVAQLVDLIQAALHVKFAKEAET